MRNESLNKYTLKAAESMDQMFILSLQKDKLNKYNLHKKPLPSQKSAPEYRHLEVHEVEIDSVFIVLHGQEKVGAYKLEYDDFGKFYRTFWLASTGKEKGVGTFIIRQSIFHSKSNKCSLIKLSVNKNNQKAIKCYISNGFKIIVKDENSDEMEMEIKI